MKIFRNIKIKKTFSDKLEILKSIFEKNKDLSKSIKTNILKETLKSNNINIKKNINLASINSKKSKQNQFFFGIKGKKYDGNKFGIDAIKNGAILAITNKKSQTQKQYFKKSFEIF